MLNLIRLLLMYLVLICCILFSNSCKGTKISDELCSEWIYLKYPVIRKGYIGEDTSPQGDICFQRKWMSYVGLSKKCIIELLGEPVEVKKNEFIYYFGVAERDMAIGVLHMYFRNGKMKKIHCSLV